MGNKTSRGNTSEEDTRGSGGCFGWVSKVIKRKKSGGRHKAKHHQAAQEDEHKETMEDAEQAEEHEQETENADEDDTSIENVPFIPPRNGRVTESNEVNAADEDGQAEACSAAAGAEDVGEERQEDEELGAAEQEPKGVMTWAEEVDDAEEKDLDVFAALTSCLPHAAFVHSVESDSTENETPAAAASSVRMSACQRRRARRRALAAARNVSAASEAAATPAESPASAENEAAAETVPSADRNDEPPALDTTPADNSDDRTTTATSSGNTATRQRRARRRALRQTIRSEARLAAATEQPPARASTPAWPSPSVRVFGRDGRPFVMTWEEAAYGAFHSQRQH